MRQLNEMFHIENDRLVKTSNGEPVPDDEPVFVLRGRDKLAGYAIAKYLHACCDPTYGVPEDRIDALMKVVDRFASYAEKRGTKVPGSTHGK